MTWSTVSEGAGGDREAVRTVSVEGLVGSCTTWDVTQMETWNLCEALSRGIAKSELYFSGILLKSHFILVIRMD